MPSISIKRIKSYWQAKSYQLIFAEKFHIDVHPTFFLNSKSFLMMKDGKPIGGYVIAPKSQSRVYRQIPKDGYGAKAFDELYKINDDFAELTGYFIDDKKAGFWLVTHWLWNVLRYPAKYFIYSYDMDNLNLRKYYSYGNPKLIYKGLINNITGMHGEHWERIELLSKLGFCRLYLRRILRQTKK